MSADLFPSTRQMALLQTSVLIVDEHLDHPHKAKNIKKLFGLEVLEDDESVSPACHFASLVDAV